MKCKICNSNSNYIFTEKIRKKYNSKFYKCNNCGFIQTEKPTWLKEAYKNPINIEDTGIIERNIYFADIVSPIIKIFFGKEKNYLDYAGGYGIFSRLMKNRGITVLWEDIYTQNLFAKELVYKNQKIEAITCFECFEHLDQPIKEIEKMLKISKTIIFSTRLIPKEIPEKNWDYYGFEHGQHIAFYSKKTLEYIAKKYDLELYTTHNLHILTNKKINKYFLFLIIYLFKIKNIFCNKIFKV